ncbi:MAG: tRNA threonylcarbamoyladenosine dehydratase [Bacilli bacterium]|jgi:tRNA A37 threonylcarbamoyladenosine dehydratase|nr:tRNA threonylcarbamoyladenosine dehydratase [Bacilli bacterium]MCH4202218.1 tRNA threonylcarbamoyladenosine dehydratase [Bacilli bacterium]MCH4236188.1 tRNA threonylcarbamoyladenosine dehydratase [Bacilli bacterium]
MNNKQPLKRFARIIGDDKIDFLTNRTVAVFGLGGVGGSACQALARAGIGTIYAYDHDVVDISNINRQAVAFFSTIKESKVEVMKRQVNDINPEISFRGYEVFVNKDNIDEIPFSSFDYVIDAIDSVGAKVALIEKAKQINIPIISSLGAGNRMDPTKLTVMDIYQTKIDPLAKVMRHELRKKGIISLDVGVSLENPIEIVDIENKRTPGSSPFVPNAMGLVLAAYAVQAMLSQYE